MARKVQKSKLPSNTKPTSSNKPVKLNVAPRGINNFLNIFLEKVINLKKSKTTYIFLIIAALLLLFVFKKDWFIAATVNGSPVTNLDLQLRLNKQFRNKTLDELVTEKIILEEARKKQAIPTKNEVEKKITEVEKYYGGKETFDMMLSQQGQTRDTVLNQIVMTMALTKLYENEATVSAEEVTQFLESNQELLQATDSAGQEKEAYEGLKNQKLSQIISQKLEELKTQAKIQIF